MSSIDVASLVNNMRKKRLGWFAYFLRKNEKEIVRVMMQWNVEKRRKEQQHELMMN